ncbi:hypothetical protein WG66_007788 [Moniliophthora roreri]|nr:hypothetical protein WG66_007788 [Moniliophthora roreri]
MTGANWSFLLRSYYAGNTSSCNERNMRGSGSRMGSMCKGSFHGLALFLDRHWNGYSLSPRSQSTHKSSVMKSNVPTNIMVDRAKNDMSRLKLFRMRNLYWLKHETSPSGMLTTRNVVELIL